jgi:hypothetical protein
VVPADQSSSELTKLYVRWLTLRTVFGVLVISFRGFDVVRLADVLHTLVVVVEPEAPFGLDRARWRLGDHVDNALVLTLGNLRERVLERHGGSRIAVPVERHVRQAAMRRDRRRLPFRPKNASSSPPRSPAFSTLADVCYRRIIAIRHPGRRACSSAATPIPSCRRSAIASDSIQGLCRLATSHHAKLKTLEKVYDLPDGDWINNEGGHGTVVLRPQEENPEDQIACDMTYGEDSDEPDFEDEDEEELLADFNAGDPADEPIAIDDSALQPATGDGQ